ncbi:MAG: M20/M25/M40 family metallo-hydrolase [Propionibacteriaceae bacterium]|jgi:acetylornithine deacetylase/succinyl-diaminopimelate desuccinylase-like protein|nr:M20/M25/M40 family metallo-hydrolase [Propionibacteriaceae bacterium]
MANISVAELRERVAEQFGETVAVLEDLVRIPSYEAPSAPPEAKQRSAEYVAELLSKVGAQDVQIVQDLKPDSTPGGPGVIGRIPGASPTTVLLYAHHDVQPVADDWSTEPFTPVQKDGRLYGRGAADDGAGVAVHYAALRALGDALGVSVAFFIEGEEEVGSPTFGKLLSKYREQLAADVVVVADSDNWQVDVPGLTTSLRGLAAVTVTVRVLEHAVHSGMFGGPLLSAPLLLARLIATLHDENGDVAVAGLGQLGAATTEYPEDELRAGAGAVPGLQLAGTGSIADRLWFKPAIDVIGFDATSVAESSNTIIPVAKAKLSLRIPPEMDAATAQNLVLTHLTSQPLFGAEVTVERDEIGTGFIADTSSPATQTCAWAQSLAFGNECKLIGQGGSIPLIDSLVEEFPGVEVLIFGVEDPDSRAHSGDESVDLGMIEKCVVAEALFLAKLGGTLQE